MNNMHISFIIAIPIALGLFFLGEPWLALVTLVGPILAILLTFLGVTAAGILTFLSLKGNVPIVAGITILFGFSILIILSAVSFFI